MKKINFLMISILLLAACSIRVADSRSTVTPRPTSIHAAQATLLPLSLTTSTHMPADEPSASPTGVSTDAPSDTPTPMSIALPTQILTGCLIYMQGVRELVELDLASGQLTTLFQATDNAWITAASVSPDGTQIVMAYAPPTTDPAQMDYTALYILPADGSAPPKIFVPRTNTQDALFTPVWSADGKYIYYAHEIANTAADQTTSTFKYVLERVSYPSGQTQQLIDNAFWPRPSPDGTKLAYVSFDPQTGDNELYLAKPDGSQPKRVLPVNDFLAVDAPLFSRDGKTILFSAVGPPRVSQRSWLDQLMGVQVAEAHNVPSEWWRVSTAGGRPEQLTNIGDTGLYGDFSPDGTSVAFISFNGLFVMAPDGSHLLQLIQNGPAGTVDWIP